MTHKTLNILITSAGRRVGLIDCFRAAADDLGLDLIVHACDLNPHLSAACQAADQAHKVCRCTDTDYIPQLLDLVEQHKIHLLIPTIDPELAPLAQANTQFAARGTQVHVSSAEVIAIVRDKARTSDVLRKAGIAVPNTATHSQIVEQAAEWAWPVFAKPSNGSASRGLQVFDSVKDIPRSFSEPMIFQDYLQGPEYTINIFVNAQGKLQTVIPHHRLQTRAGEVEKGITIRNPLFQSIAESIVTALPGARGVLCFQLIDDPKLGPRVFEINARFGGGYPLADYAGAKFATWLLQEVTGQPISAHNQWREGVEMMRYDAAIYRG